MLRGRPGPARDAWLARLAILMRPGSGIHRVPPNVSDGRLIGGLDLAATLSSGRPVEERGLLEIASGGTIVLPLAERISAALAARIAQVVDTGEVRVERDGLMNRRETRFGVVALDEGDGDEHPPAVLLDRLAFHVDLTRMRLDDLVEDLLPGAEEVERARQRLPRVSTGEDAIRTLCEVSVALGVDSLGVVQRALCAARAAAAYAGDVRVGESHILLAIRLVLIARATRMPRPATPPAEADSPEPTSPERATPQLHQQPSPSLAQDESDTHDTEPSSPGQSEAPDALGEGIAHERILAAVRASLPADLIARLDAGQDETRSRASASGGRSGRAKESVRTGRVVGSRRGMPGSGRRLALMDTLVAAAPWQNLRRRATADLAATAATAATANPRSSAVRLHVRPDDLRIARTRQRTRSTTIFVVDASGSTAVHRLAEAKGAVERLLGQSYVRRDQVALIAFRGRGAQILLPPTRSLVRAKRELASLPGGGGTPLASGIYATLALAQQIRRDGGRPIAVFLSDGQANVAHDGSLGRPLAFAGSLEAAKRLREANVVALFVDTSPRPRDAALEIANAMGAQYMLLSRAPSDALAAAARALGESAERVRPAATRRDAALRA